MNLSGKTVLIPGASRLIGRAIARRFAQAGANLVLPWYDWPESVKEMDEEFIRSGTSTLSMKCDLRNLDLVNELLERARDKFSTIDYLVNNIERGGMPVVHGSYFHDHNKDQWQLEVETTIKAKWNLYQCTKPLMTGPHCAIVNISSIAGLVGRSGPAACFFNDGYSAANSAIRNLTETWARECAPRIRVNELMIGLIDGRHGDHTRGWTILTDSEKRLLLNHTLLERTGTPQEVAQMVYFLAIEASYLTGSVIRMDGGYVLGGEHVPSLPAGVLG
ncbi:SDR family NAD(P)-dependent oxidoreductase [Desulfosediminicola ganghwensis]|uniref:SDR family NAD(P)-dependent oxidoreductase n=1 Tax=Desulfosediminicola ganghwensis TaxID=2569540 RepID=UPI0010AD19C4|nr:SDR family oxidoreductase [Desulfosediminicola ganghwensis]